MTIAFNSSSWAESITEEQSAVISVDDSTMRMSITVAGENYEDALQYILPTTGMQRIDTLGTTPVTFRLLRNIPAKWPFATDQEAWAYSVKTTGVGSVERVLKPDLTYTPGMTRVPTGTLSPLNWSRNIDAGGDVSDAVVNQQVVLPGYFRYEKYLFTIDFKPITYPMYSDDVIVPYQSDYDEVLGNDGVIKWKEWERWVTWTFEPYAELIQLSGSRLQFAESALSPDPITGIIRPPAAGRTFPVPLGLIEQKGIVTAYWHNVPADFVLGTGNKMTNILNAMGTVNSVPFPRDFIGGDSKKFLPGTLLLSDVPQCIVKPIGIRQRGSFYVFPWQYDIILKFRWFDPPIGNPNQIKNAAGNTIGTRPPLPALLPGVEEPVAKRPRGHLLFPPAGQNYYLYANRLPFEKNIPAIAPAVDNIDNPPLYKQTDFGNIFQFNRG